MTKYPSHWVPATINETGQYINGFGFREIHREETGLPIVRIQNLTNLKSAFNFTTYLPDEKYLVTPGTILVSWSATLDAFVWNGGNAVLNQHIFKVVPDASVVEKDFLFFLLKKVIAELREGSNMRGTTMRHINRKPFLDHPVALPSLLEQKRISAAIRTAFEHIEKAEQKLVRIFSQMAELKRAVFREATHGALTKRWREEHADSDANYSTEKLLERAANLRRFRWEQRKELDFLQAEKKVKDQSWKNKYPAPAAHDVSHLPEMPLGWTWTSLDQIAEIRSGLTINRQNVPSNEIVVPYLRVANVQRGYLDLTEVKTVSIGRKEFEELKLERGDILFNEGGDRDKLGRGWVWEEQLVECVHQNHVFRARLVTDEIEPRFVSIWGNSFGQHYFDRVAKQTTNLASISLGKLARLPVPIPPIREQQEILSKIETMFDLVDTQEKQLEAKLRALALLRGRILSSAFSGTLVEPDLSPHAHLGQDFVSTEFKNLSATSVIENSKKMKELPQKNAVSLRDIIFDNPNGITPSELFRLSRYSLRDVDAFYEELSTIMDSGMLEQVSKDDDFEPLLRIIDKGHISSTNETGKNNAN
jgi:type I restriction enzyme S subunit